MHWFRSKMDAVNFKWVLITVLLCFVAFFMLTGKVSTVVMEDSVRISATYWPALPISYDEMLEVSYYDHFEKGERTNGIGSLRLQLGNYKNAQFGKYILYAYSSCDSCVVIKTKERTIAINCKSKEQMQELYQQIMQHMNRK